MSRSKIWTIIFFTLAMNTGVPLRAQYFEFSQYNFTPQRVNPGQIASTNYATLGGIYRNQATPGGFSLNSTMINASYPFIAKNGTRWCGIGISLMDDRAGSTGLFTTQEAALSYAINVPVAKNQTLSLGAKALYQRWSINVDGFYTGSQYVPDRGFDIALSPGENLGELRNSFMTYSAGLYWQQVDTKGNRIAYGGLSYFDFNKPSDSFMGTSSQLNSTYVGTFGFRAYQHANLSVMPEMLLTRNASLNVVNVGFTTRYDLAPQVKQTRAHVDVITKYVINRSAIIGLQLHRENVSIGFSYDFPAARQNVANTGAFEIGLELRRLVKPRKLPNKKQKTIPVKTVSRQPLQKADTAKTKIPNAAPQKSVVKKESMSTRLQQKQDSVKANAKAGAMMFEALALEKTILHVNFKFNSSALDDETLQYLNDLAQALAENPKLKIRLTGHTDNIGSLRFNQKLSVYRAETIRSLLIEKGIDGERIKAEGKGMTEPLNDNLSEEDRARNRRVDVVILYEN
jgi:type IX secretion system PorP/SprF family membrane protein